MCVNIIIHFTDDKRKAVEREQQLLDKEDDGEENINNENDPRMANSTQKAKECSKGRKKVIFHFCVLHQCII